MRSHFAVALLICFASSVQGADVENPYKKAAVGDWVEYKMTGPNIEGTTKMTIVAKDDKEVSYEVAATFNGQTAPRQKLKIDLTKSYDAVSAANLKANNTKIETVGEGTEKLKVGDKDYDTKWTKLKSTTTVSNFTIVSEYQMWFAKEVPLSGLVKMDTTTSTITTKLELIGSGHK